LVRKKKGWPRWEKSIGGGQYSSGEREKALRGRNVSYWEKRTKRQKSEEGAADTNSRLGK